MPAFIAILVRIGIYLGSMLLGASIAAAIDRIAARRRERLRIERDKRRAASPKFKGFESQAHEHESQN